MEKGDATYFHAFSHEYLCYGHKTSNLTPGFGGPILLYILYTFYTIYSQCLHIKNTAIRKDMIYIHKEIHIGIYRRAFTDLCYVCGLRVNNSLCRRGGQIRALLKTQVKISRITLNKNNEGS